MKRFLRQWIGYIPGRALPAASSLALLLIAARTLSAVDVGIYGIVSTAALLLAAALGNWLDSAAMRHYPQYLRESGEQAFHAVHGSVFTVIWFSSVATGVLIAAVSVPIAGQFSDYISGALLLLASSMLVTSAQAVLVAKGLAHRYSVNEIIRAGVTLVTAAVLLWAGLRNANALLFGGALGNLAGAALSLRSATILRRPAFDAATKKYARTAAAYGLPLLGWFLGSQILSVSDRFLIQLMIGTREAGIYHANYQLLPGVFAVILSPLLMAAHTTLLREAEEGTVRSTTSALSRHTRYFFLFATPIAVVLGFSSQRVTAMVLGEPYSDGFAVAPLVLLGLLGWTAGMYAHKRFEIAKRTDRMVILVGVCCAANLVLTAALLPVLGYIGAAVATCVSYWLYPILVAAYPGDWIRWRLFTASTGRIALANGVGVTVALSLRVMLHPTALATDVVVLAVIPVAVTTAVLLALGELKGEWQVARAWIRASRVPPAGDEF